MIDLILGFPFNLIWVGIIIWYYRPSVQIGTLWLVFSSFLLLSQFLPFELKLSLWQPGGLITILFTTIFYIYIKNKETTLDWFLEITKRTEMAKELNDARDKEHRQSIYNALVKKRHEQFVEKDKVITPVNTKILLFVFISAFFLSFLFLIYLYSVSSKFQEYLPTALKATLKMMGQKIKNNELNELIKEIYLISPAIVFIKSVIIQILTFIVIQKVLFNKTGKMHLLGSITFFKLPEYLIWIFIAVVGGFVLSLQIELPDLIFAAILNLFIILFFIYFIYGVGLLRLFFQMRLMPMSWLILGLLLSALIVPELIGLFVTLIVFIGLLDFWINFRKKALHPAILFQSDR